MAPVAPFTADVAGPSVPAPTIEVTPDRPAAVESEVDLDQARAVRSPAEPAQAKAGNYQQTHLRWRGLDIAIETESSPIANWITRSGCPRAPWWGRGSDLTQYDPERKCSRPPRPPP